MNRYDGRTPFERMCRVPGTRCNAIMEMIERGMTDEEIANTIKHTPSKYRGINPNASCEVKTIRVYRKALTGTLVEASGEAFRTDERPGDGLIKKLKAQGMTVPAICEAMGLRRRQVEGRLYSKKQRKAKKAAPENAEG